MTLKKNKRIVEIKMEYEYDEAIMRKIII